MPISALQQENHQLVLTSKSIDWLTHNTAVSVFDPVAFKGYQRQIDEKHCLKIVNYLKTSCFLPSAIICACEEYSDQTALRIVDGQHRVQAFRMLEEQDPQRYAEIKDVEIPIVVMVDVPPETEIQTFITINKTSKKVDTSLAYVLKNQLSKGVGDMAMPRSEYIAVEVAVKLNENEDSNLWTNRILYEGNVKKSNCYISLNAFVRATRILINTLGQTGYINLKWDSDTKKEEVEMIVDKATELIYFVWGTVYQRWPELIDASFEEKQILQGSIGYTAITKTLVKLIKEKNIDGDGIKPFILNTILSFGVPYDQWTKKGGFSSYSSEAGYRIVSDSLIKSIKKEQ